MNISSPPSPSRWKRLWCGRDGLRTGWAVALFFVILALTVVLLGHLAYLLHHPLTLHGHLTPGHMITNEAVLCCGALVATWVMARLDHRPWSSYGLRAPHGAAQFGQGAVCGAVMLATVMGVLYLTHAATITLSGVDAGSLFASGILWAVAFCLVAAAEELTFRGFAFFRLARGRNPLVATLVMSLLFACAHLSNPGESVTGIAMVITFGLVACLAVWRTGSLWWALGLHAAWDWSQTFLFGTADSGLVATGHLLTSHATGPAWLSGGTVGPEGSLIVFPAMAVLALVAVWTLPRAKAAPGITRHPRTAASTAPSSEA